jgi:hypothetical protein
MTDTLEGLTYREVLILAELVSAELEARARHARDIGEIDYDPELEAISDKLRGALGARTDRGNDLLLSLISPTGGI